jgi:large subunit ribosomal protein L9
VKVIFIEDVQNVARAGQTKEVANGYARNFLFPRKLAVLANSNAASMVEAHLKKVAKRRAIEEAEMAALAKTINGVEIVLKAKVGENDKLYGSVTGADIADALSKNINREIDKRKVDLAEPIRLVGVYDVIIRFTHDITATVVVVAMSDEPEAVKPVRVEKKAETTEVKEEKAEKKEKTPKAPKAEKTEEKEEKADKKEKKEKLPKAPKAEKIEAKEEKIEKQAEPSQVVKEEKPVKEKKAKAEKTGKEAKPEEEKKEKKPKAEKKARKSEAKTEE